MLAGLKMNINRPFGNGRDDNGNGVVTIADARRETAQRSQHRCASSSRRSATFSYDGITTRRRTLAADSLAARQLEARYLYVLMCLTCRPELS